MEIQLVPDVTGEKQQLVTLTSVGGMAMDLDCLIWTTARDRRLESCHWIRRVAVHVKDGLPLLMGVYTMGG